MIAKKRISEPLNNIWDKRNESLNTFLDERLIVSVNNCIHIVDTNKMIYIKALSNYSEIYLLDGKTILISKTLKHYESLLEGRGFLRVHNSYLVNLFKITEIKRNGMYTIIKENGTQIPVSRSFRDNLFTKSL